jgi:hypothetical protein
VKQYQNYVMVIEWRYTEQGNNDSGIFLRAGMDGKPWPSSPQLNMGPGQNYGSIGGSNKGGQSAANLINPVGEWNVFHITVDRNMVALAINGKEAWGPGQYATLNGPDRAGYVGIEAEGRPIEFRNIWISELK